MFSLFVFTTCACSRPRSHQPQVVTPVPSARIQEAFNVALNDVKVSHLNIYGPDSANWTSWILPLSASEVLKSGPPAVPSLEYLRALPGEQRQILAEACLAIIRAKKVDRGIPFLLPKQQTKFVCYTVWR